MLLGERLDDQAEGALDLTVGEIVLAALPGDDHAKAPLIGLGQADQRLRDPCQVRGTLI